MENEIEKILEELVNDLPIDEDSIPRDFGNIAKEKISQASLAIRLALVKKVEGMKKKVQDIIKYRTYSPETHIFKRAYNSAIDDVIKLLEE